MVLIQVLSFLLRHCLRICGTSHSLTSNECSLFIGFYLFFMGISKQRPTKSTCAISRSQTGKYIKISISGRTPLYKWTSTIWQYNQQYQSSHLRKLPNWSNHFHTQADIHSDSSPVCWSTFSRSDRYWDISCTRLCPDTGYCWLDQLQS